MNKSKLLPAAIAGILGAAAASSAYAVTTVDAAHTLFIGGATATDLALRSVILRTGGPCAAGTIDVYVEGTSAGSGKNIAILCKTSSDAVLGAGTTGTDVAFVKESNGGSDRGTVFVSQSLPLSLRDPTTANADCLTVSGVGANTSPLVNNQAFTLHGNCTAASLTNVAPDVGIADVDPRMFNVGTQTVSDSDINALDTQPLYQPMFAIAVSLNLYRALQRAQGKTLDDTEANMPTMTSAQIRGAFAQGGLASWANITSSTGVAINNTAFTGGVTVPNTMYVCRRGDESGTQAGTAQYFLNERCALSTSPQLFKNPSGGTNPLATKQLGETWVTSGAGSTAARIVFAGAGSGDVRNCLDGRNDLDQFAIGLLGSESVYDNVGGNGGSASSATANQFRYIAIDGMKPDVVEAANGRYDFVMENVINTRISPPLPTVKASLASEIKDNFNDPTIVASTLIQKGNTHGWTGGLLPANKGTFGGSPATQATLTTNPVSAFAKSTGTSVNNCNFPINLRAAPTN